MSNSTVHEGVRPLGVGVAGLGEIGVHHVRAVQSSSAGRLAAICDLDSDARQRVGKDTGAEAFGDVEDLLKDDAVNVVSVCLPHNLHASVVEAALRAGKHCFVEKPLATTVAECDQLIKLAEERELALGVSHNELFYPPHARAKRLIDSGDLGEPLLLRLRLAADGPYPGWRSNPAQAGGGVLFDAGVHRIYLARSLFGPIANLRGLVDQPRDVGECFGLVAIEFESGARGIIEANFHAPSGYFDDSVEVMCREGGLFIAGIESQYVGFRPGPALRRFQGGEWRDEPLLEATWESSIDQSVDAFLSAVSANSPLPVSAADGREIVDLLERFYEAAEPWAGT
jgi:predicted dehydrogenase